MDNANLLNVAISRGENNLIIILKLGSFRIQGLISYNIVNNPNKR